METFKELGLNSDIMKSLDDLGFTEPSPIQEKAIPFILKAKKDLIALAQTGTGKTAAFGLPILNQIKAGEKDLQAIILCPTRELCLQIAKDVKELAKHSKGIDVTAVYGGERIDIQINALRRGTNIVVGTPGRVHDLIRRRILNLQSIKWVVLDEADEMLDMGFKDELDAILEQTPKTRQTLLFSATMSRSVGAIAKKYMAEAEEISIGTKNIGADNVSHEYYLVQARDRFESLKRILDSLPGVYGILFCRTRIETQEVADKLRRAEYDTDALHGDISQSVRTKIMDRFKRKKMGLLVATDVAARGIDINDLTHVINYNLPDKDEGYTHRSGRTGRAKKSGVAISIVSPRDARRIRGLENIVGKTIEQKQVPNGEDVCLKQINNFIEEIENTDIKSAGNQKYFEEITKRLKKINKEDLIKYFVTHKFSHLMGSYESARDLNTTSRDFGARSNDSRSRVMGDSVYLKINFGRKHGFGIKDLFALINSNKNLKGIELGTIELKAEYSIFGVEKNRADDAIKNLNGLSYRGKKVSVIRSNEAIRENRRPSRGRPSRGRSDGRPSGGRPSRGRADGGQGYSRDRRGSNNSKGSSRGFRGGRGRR